MTWSEKRFELAYSDDGWWAVRDSEITLWKEEVVDLLNEQEKRIEVQQRIISNQELRLNKIKTVLKESYNEIPKGYDAHSTIFIIAEKLGIEM